MLSPFVDALPMVARPDARHAPSDSRGSMRLTPRAAVVVVVTIAAWPVRLAAQPGTKEPARPKIDAAADTNDWQAYYEYGNSAITGHPDIAANAFYWATRLSPERAELYYGQWAATWMTKPGLLRRYFKGGELVGNSIEARRIDTLAWEATIRNPLVHRGFHRLLFQMMYDLQDGKGNWRWKDDPENEAWLDYTEGRFANAAAGWGSVLAKNPKRFFLHEQRAYAFASMQRFDSAIVSLTRLLAELDKRELKTLSHSYESKAIYLYAIGIMNYRTGNYDAAREAFGRALEEDLSMYMVHSALGSVAIAQGDTATALTEYDLAVQLNDGDPVLLKNYGLLLLLSNRVEEAATVLARSVAADTWYAQPRYFHAVALDRLGRKDEARAEYGEFMGRAPRTAGDRTRLAAQRIAELRGAPAERK